MDMNNRLLALVAGFVLTGMVAFGVMELFEMTRLDAGQFRPTPATVATRS